MSRAGRERSKENETTCSLLTGSGQAAVAVIEVRGPRSADCIATQFRPANDHALRPNEIRYGLWGDGTGESIVVVRSSDQRFEIHCHGGSAAIDRILNDLSSAGAQQRLPAPAEVFGPDGDRLIHEACDILCRCVTVRTAAIALDQVRGALRDWRQSAIERLRESPESAPVIASEASLIAERGRFGLRLSRPFEVTLVGPPNVGKSSLLNAIAGFERSITMDLPGTTRDVIEVETVVDGWPIKFRDTAGIRSVSGPKASDSSDVAASQIEQEGIVFAKKAAETADLLVSVSEPKGRQLDLDFGSPVLRVLNKADQLENASTQSGAPFGGDWLRTVATLGDGIETLLDEILEKLIGETPLAGSPVPVNERQHQWLDELATQVEAASMLMCLQRS
ncbi:MAG: GTPase [Planctomycetota bacterium]